MDPATAVTFFHPASDGADFDDWATELVALAQEAPGCVTAGISVHDRPGLECAVAVVFTTEAALHGWLDSPHRLQFLRDGQCRGFWSAETDLVLNDANPPPPGVAAFRHMPIPGKEDEFRDAQHQLTAAVARFTGYRGSALIALPAQGDWLSVVRFRTGAQLAAWVESDTRAVALRGLRSSLSRDFSVFSSTTPFATTVRIEGGRTLMTPNWKSAMMVLLVLYPTVMLLSRFVGPVLDGWGAEPWLALWVSQIISVTLMQWWLMPAVTRPFRRWLDPVAGDCARTRLVGAGVVVACYAVTLTLFATLKWLQYWDYRD